MKRFVFALDPVLEQRERVERDHQLRVAQVERERIALEDQLRNCQARIQAAKHELRDHMSGDGRGVVPVHAVRLQAHATLHMEVLARRSVLELSGAFERLKLARNELARATAARKSVSLLKAKRYEEWKRAMAKQEAADLDELVVMRHARRDHES